MSLTLLKQTSLSGTPALLPSSKSISNRALILNALADNQSHLHNLSSARDTSLMRALVGSDDKLINVMDAGTTMRFLTAYFAITGKNKILTGTDRMKERPIELLVDALRGIGASIEYLETAGFPPVEINGFLHQKKSVIQMPGDVSSQYISALMMIAPQLQDGLTIELTGNVGSLPYIKMTASLMEYFGLKCDFTGNKIIVPKGTYHPTELTIEADWSAASYWFAFVAMAENANIVLHNISIESLQGDSVIIEVMKKLGVQSVYKKNQLTLSKQPHESDIEWDFRNCPDLAQTVLPVCAAKDIKGTFTGLESLRIKETDRIAALQNELKKIGTEILEEGSTWTLQPNFNKLENVNFKTYHDHRMAMGLAPLATLMNVSFDDSSVVNKSYPGFWDDCKYVGFKII